VTAAELSSQFSTLDLTDSPPVAGFDNDRSRILWLLYVARHKLNLDLLAPGDISAVLRDVFRIDISRQRVGAILDAESKTPTVARRVKKGRRLFQVMQPGMDEIAVSSPTVVFIHPAQALTQYRKVEAILSQLEGDLRLCDPYIDRRSLDVIGNCTKARSINLLSANIKNVNALKGDLKVFAKQNGAILEVRTAPPALLHDRYVIHDSGMLLIGTSLNGLGLKQSFVVETGMDIRAAVLTVFDAAWKVAIAI
jgi:hypothetical protein